MVGVYAELGVNGPETTDLRAKAVAYLNSPMGEMLASTVYAELGWAAFINRRYDEALDLFERGLAGSSASKVVELPSLLLGLASVRERAGDLAAASDLVSEAADLVEQRVMVLPRPLVAMVKGSMLVTEKRYGEAADVLTAGAAEAAAMGYARIEWRLRAAAAGALALDERVEESFRETAETRRLISALADRFVDASPPHFDGHYFGSVGRSNDLRPESMDWCALSLSATRAEVRTSLLARPQLVVFDVERRPSLWMEVSGLLDDVDVVARRLPVVDSLERIVNDRVVAHVDREHLFCVVPPYLMTAESLTRLIDNLSADPTDWFTAVVEAGARVRLTDA
jgi:tetratricopeptide (TPR) repeat protein